MPYIVKNGIPYAGNAVTVTQAQYDALSEAEKKNGTVYYIYDSDALLDASDVSYDNTSSGLSAANTQAAIDEISSDVESLNNGLNDKLTTISGYKRILTFRNVNLTYTDGTATYDISDKIGRTNEVIGVATYPYNRMTPSAVVANNGVLSINNVNTSISGSYYTNMIILVF